MKPSRFLPILALAVVAAGLAASLRLPVSTSPWQRAARPDPPLLQAPPSPGPLHPVPEMPVRPLPLLEESDKALRAAIGKLPGSEEMLALLVREDLVRRFVASVDRCTGAQLPARHHPLAGPGPRPAVEGRVLLGPVDFARYEPHVRAVEAIDAESAVGLYGRLYPLFQQAYAGLGKRGYFNDALVRAVDHLLEAPEPESIELVRRRDVYEYADPRLEALSGGQKLLVRLGRAHAARLKAKLLEVRGMLASYRPGPS